MIKYGMKHRGYSIGCQPSGVIKVEDSDKNKTGYWSFIYYENKLTEEQILKYELEEIGEEE